MSLRSLRRFRSPHYEEREGTQKPGINRTSTLTISHSDMGKLKVTTVEDVKKEYGLDKPKPANRPKIMNKVANFIRSERGHTPDAILSSHIRARDFVSLNPFAVPHGTELPGWAT